MNTPNTEAYKGVFVFAQQVDNQVSGIAYELLGKAKELAADLDTKEVTAVLIGSDVKGLADELAQYGADKVEGRILFEDYYVVDELESCQHEGATLLVYDGSALTLESVY